MLQKKIFIFILLCLLLLILNYNDFFFFNEKLDIHDDIINISQEILNTDKQIINDNNLNKEEFAKDIFKEYNEAVKQCPFNQLRARGFSREDALNIINSYDADELMDVNIDTFLEKNNIK